MARGLKRAINQALNEHHLGDFADRFRQLDSVPIRQANASVTFGFTDQLWVRRAVSAKTVAAKVNPDHINRIVRPRRDGQHMAARGVHLVRRDRPSDLICKSEILSLLMSTLGRKRTLATNSALRDVRDFSQINNAEASERDGYQESNGDKDGSPDKETAAAVRLVLF